MSTKSRNKLIILFIAIMLTASFLRGPIVTIGPISEILINELNITSTEFGLITTLPLLVFAFSSTIIPFIISRFGLIQTMISGVFLLIIGSLLRSFDNYYILLLGTIVVGFGISIGNVLIPAIIKEFTGEKRSIFTSFYLCTQNIFASIASGFAYFLAIKFSWIFLMLLWIIPAIFALIAWYKFHKDYRNENMTTSINKLAWPIIKELLNSSYAWSITMIMGLQSILYFTFAAWLPEIVTNFGHSQEYFSILLVLFQLAPLPAMFLVPILVKKVKENSYILLFASVSSLIGLSLLITSTSIVALIIATICIAVGISNCYAWVVAVITHSTKDAQQAASLSAMSQTIGYFMAAIGPLVAGILVDLTNNTSTIAYFTFGVGIAIAIFSTIIYLKRKTFKFE